MPPSIPLTTHLLNLSLPSLTQATTHPFLRAAATSSLPLPLLKTWLAQDRLYALSYLTFASTLLSHTRVPPDSPPSSRPHTLGWRVADALIDCLTNIRRELDLFEATAREEGWEADVGGAHVREAPATRAYADLFAGASAGGRHPLVGLTALWATEECYLRAWGFARGFLPGGGGEGEGKGDVMQRVFIPNWSSEEFGRFVGRLRGLVDEMAEGLERDGWVWRECEDVWMRVLRVEEEFWPRVGGE